MIRKLMLVAAVAMLVLPNAVNAQDVTVTATVSPTFSLGGSGDLAFGPLSSTVDNTIAAASGAIRTLDYNHNVTVTFNAPAVLSAAGLTDLPVALMCASELGGVWSAEQLCSSAAIDLDVGAALTQATLGFGGTIAAADVADAAAGDYAGVFDITVTAR